MKDVKLTDFSEGQLQDLLNEVVFAVRGIEREHCAPESFLLHNSQRYNNLCLWRTQILNAISTVKMRNIPQQN